MTIRRAESHEFGSVRDFYHELIDTSPYVPLWEKDVFPEDRDLSDTINKGNLFVGIEDGHIVSSVVTSHENDLACLDLLGVLPSYTGRGFARQMVSFVIEKARKDGFSAVRLDVLNGNIRAESLYISMGFEYVSSFEEHYERTGTMVFKIYEFRI